MFLEERVEQLERLTAEQGQQTEIVANGLAVLTVEVRGIRHDMTTKFEEVNQRFEQIDRQFEEVRQEFAKVNQRLDEMNTTQQLILTILIENRNKA